MEDDMISQVFNNGWLDYKESHHLSPVQHKAGNAIFKCKTPDMGCNTSVCEECGYIQVHNNSCRNRNCPKCQAVNKVIWVDARQSEVIDSPYFHAVFTVPFELNTLIYENQKVLYSLLHKCAAECILELAQSKKYIGGTPGIIQVLHTWGSDLKFHPHIHSIISGGCLSSDKTKILTRGDGFFLPVHVVSKKFRGKFLYYLKLLRKEEKLNFKGKAQYLRNSYEWSEYIDKLYKKDWIFYIKETFNRFGNAIKYLGKYTHRVAISNKRIRSVDSNSVTFSVKDYKHGGYKDVTISLEEFISRFMNHILPYRFQKIRYYGFLNNHYKNKNLKIIFKIQNKRRFMSVYSGKSKAEIIKSQWGFDITLCPCCGKPALKPIGRTYPLRE